MIPESNIIDFDQYGGYRLEQPTLKKLQATSFLFLKALIGHFGIPDVGNYIISGCNVVGDNITEGILYIDGILCPFEETPGTLASKIKRVETLESLEFFNGTTPTVFKKITALIDDDGTLLSEFVRVPSPFNLPANLVIDANYVHTDNNFSDSWLVHLASIEFGAQANVQTDWLITNPGSFAYLKNRPQDLVRLLKSDVINIGDVTDVNLTATIEFPELGLTDTNYDINVEIESLSNILDTVKSAAKMGHVVYDKQVGSCKVCFQEMAGAGVQNAQIRYQIFKR